MHYIIIVANSLKLSQPCTRFFVFLEKIKTTAKFHAVSLEGAVGAPIRYSSTFDLVYTIHKVTIQIYVKIITSCQLYYKKACILNVVQLDIYSRSRSQRFRSAKSKIYQIVFLFHFLFILFLEGVISSY